jgi:3'-phosphoadenosine 5'-phosphosulfate sulfotransferase (PAPS reductase)/FAD synthetase
MTILEYKQGDLVIFCDTGREHDKTYKFLNDFEAFENIPIVRLKYEGGFERLIEKRKALPNIMMRFCTIELKPIMILISKISRIILWELNLNIKPT